MKNKIGLRTWMFLKIAPSALLVLLYQVNVGIGSPLGDAIMTIVVMGFFIAFSYLDSRKDLFDELAKENLRRADSICLKAAYAFGIVAVFSAVFYSRFLFTSFPFAELSGIIIGYCIVFLILVFTTLRAIIFSIIDKRGI